MVSLIMKYIKYVLFFLASFVISFLVLNSLPVSYLNVKDQAKGTTIEVGFVRLSKLSFLVVQTIDPVSGLTDKGGFLNNPSPLPPGIYRNVNLSLTNVSGEIPDKVAVTLYEDTNKNDSFDGYYDHEDGVIIEEDKPIFNLVNKKIIRKVILLK